MNKSYSDEHTGSERYEVPTCGFPLCSTLHVEARGFIVKYYSMEARSCLLVVYVRSLIVSSKISYRV